jgi:Cdc6-like AAA superfamily ATPase
MPKDKIKKAAITNVGYIYQLLHGIKILAEWFEAPHKFTKVKFECDDQKDAPQSLDDIVIEKTDGRIEYIQVKHTPNPQKHFLTWEWLTEKKRENTKSNIQKWLNAFKQIPKGKLESAKLITNRIPDGCFAKILSEKSTITLDLIPQKLFDVIQEQLGESDAVKQFFDNFEIHHSEKEYLNLENEIKGKLQKVFCVLGYHQLYDEAEKWSRLKNFPSPDGWITFEILNRVATRKHSEPLKEDFKIPRHYQIPDEDFHQNFIKQIMKSDERVVTLVGPPGRGKSTYLSFLCKYFRKKHIPFVRHHYYLSREYFSTDRYSYYHIQNTINSQIRANYPDVEILEGSDTRLKESLEKCGSHFKDSNKKFLVIIDGLDHVWRENNHDKKPLDDLFNGIFPIPENVTLIIGTQPIGDSQLPNRLLSCSSRDTWIELPSMSSSSIKQYLSGFFNIQNDHTLNSAAESIRLRTGGHPLHLIYATEYLSNNNIPLTEANIERIPGDMSHSVKEYYQSLWIHLNEPQKNALALLAEYPFYWPFSSFTKAIDIINNFSMDDLNGVKYLLHKTISGYKIFHDSLNVFIKGESSYTQRIEHSYPMVHEWLLKSAPDNLRHLWLWLIEARNGDYTNLFSKINRNWVIERLSEGYSFNEIGWLLQEVETTAFEQGKFSHQYKMHHLRERVSRANMQGIYLPDVNKLSLKYGKNRQLLDHAVSEVDNVSPGYAFAVGEILYDENKRKDAEDTARTAYQILQDEKELEEHERHLGISDEEMHGYTILGYMNALDTEKWDLSHFSKEEFDIFTAIVKGVVKSQNLQYLQSMHKQKMAVQYTRHLEDNIIILSKVLSFDLSALPEFTKYKTGILPQLAAISKKQGNFRL